MSIFNVAAGIAPVPGTPLERQSYNDLSLDADGVVRRDLVYAGQDDDGGLSLARAGSRHRRRSCRTRNQVRIQAHGCRQMVGDINEIDAGLGQRLLRFRPAQLRDLHLAEVIDGEVPEAMLRDRVVLIGSTTSLRDLFEVPHRDSIGVKTCSRFQAWRCMPTVGHLDGGARRDLSTGLVDAWLGQSSTGGRPEHGVLLGERIQKQRLSIFVVGS